MNFLVCVPLFLPFTKSFTIIPGSGENAHAVCQAMCPREILSRKHSVLWTLALDSEQFLITCT